MTRQIHSYNLVILISFSLLFSCSSNQNSKNNEPEIPIQIVEDRSILHRVVNPNLIKKFGIKYLDVENCLYESNCFHTEYVFNACGEIENYFPPMVASSWHYEYDENCRLISETSKNFVLYKYTFLENDSVKQDVYDISNDTTYQLTGRFKFKNSSPDFYNLDEILKPDTVGNLTFPCGEEYHGRHIVLHNLYENGLIKSVHYLDSSYKVVVEEGYYYSTLNNKRINFE